MGIKKYFFTVVCIIIFSVAAYSKDNYVFDSNKIKKVFCQWEMTQEEIKNNYYMRLYNKEEDIFLDISNYANGDTKKNAEKRFYNIAINDGYTFVGQDNISKKILGEPSIKYSGTFRGGKRIKNEFFFDEIKISIGNSSTDQQYINTLNLIREAIDPAVKVKERAPINHGKIYQVEDMFDIKKLEKSIKKYNKYVKVLVEEKGNNETGSRISFALDDSGKAVVERSIILEANIHFSEKVQKRRWEHFMTYLTFKNPVENRISEKYFGVPSVEMRSRKPKNYGYDAIGVSNVIVTEDYTIQTLNYVLQGDTKLQEVEYEEMLELVKRALKDYKK